MSGVANSKKALQPDSPEDSPNLGRKTVITFNNLPEVSKYQEIWERHYFNITIIGVNLFLLMYCIIAIAISGFYNVRILFGITMFLWFCLIYMFVQEHFGGAIYRHCMRPIGEAIESQWRWLKW